MHLCWARPEPYPSDYSYILPLAALIVNPGIGSSECDMETSLPNIALEAANVAEAYKASTGSASRNTIRTVDKAQDAAAGDLSNPQCSFPSLDGQSRTSAPCIWTMCM
jgi:hypothetical protein